MQSTRIKQNDSNLKPKLPGAGSGHSYNFVIPSFLPGKVFNHKILLRNQKKNRAIQEWLRKVPRIVVQKNFNPSPQADNQQRQSSTIPTEQNEFNTYNKLQEKELHTARDHLLGKEKIESLKFNSPKENQEELEAEGASKSTRNNVSAALLIKVEAPLSKDQFLKTAKLESDLNQVEKYFPTYNQRSKLNLGKKYEFKLADSIDNQPLEKKIPKKVSQSYRSKSGAFLSTLDREITKENRYTNQALALKRPTALKDSDSRYFLDVKSVALLKSPIQNPMQRKNSPRTHRILHSGTPQKQLPIANLSSRVPGEYAVKSNRLQPFELNYSKSTSKLPLALAKDVSTKTDFKLASIPQQTDRVNPLDARHNTSFSLCGDTISDSKTTETATMRAEFSSDQNISSLPKENLPNKTFLVPKK